MKPGIAPAPVLAAELPPAAATPTGAEGLRQRTRTGALWSIIGAGALKGFPLAGGLIAARFLGAVQYGELGILQTTLGTVQALAAFGTGVTATKYLAQYRASDPSRAGRLLALSTAVAVLGGILSAAGLALAADWLATGPLAAPQLAPLLRLTAVALLLGVIAAEQQGAIAGLEAFSALARTNIVSGLLSLIALVAGVAFAGLAGAVWALVGVAAITLLINHWTLSRAGAAVGIRAHWGGMLAEWPILWRFCLPAFLATLLVGPVNWIAASMVVNVEHGYFQMGLLNAAAQWRSVILFVPVAVGGSALPVLANLFGAGEFASFRRLVRRYVLVALGAGAAAALPVALASGWILSAYGAEFVAGRWILVLMAGAGLLMAVANMVGNVINAAGRAWTGLAFNAGWAALFLVACAVLVPRHGALGQALALCLSYAVHSGLQFLYVQRIR